MRQSKPLNTGVPVAQIVLVGLLASVATGCSSNATRFSGLFSDKDTLTTASVVRPSGPQITGLNSPPVPMADINNAGGTYAPTGGDYSTRQQALSQPYPGASPARSSASPSVVQSAALAPPPGATATNAPISSRRGSAASFPADKAATATPDRGDSMTTGTIPEPKHEQANGWSTTNAPRVTLRPGESVAMLANRYGVPEKEILRANNLASARSAQPGQTIVIPTFGARSTPARTAAAEGMLVPPGHAPMPREHREEKVAVLPVNPKMRDKARSDLAASNADTASGSGPMPPAAGTYVVKPGDSLVKIARENGVSVDALKKANGLGVASVRVGQTLNLPEADQRPAATPVSLSASASVSPAPAHQQAPSANQTVNQVASIDPNEKAPETTGIGKYRWPVRGAVVAGFGANVGGKRNDGIDISVPQGTAIKAAENGVVIYAGNGLKELGNTVLLRHQDGTVTVYAHAETITVHRGQNVTRGQEIALSGMTGNATQPTLHFEVRKDATPVNPMKFLE
ncbi:peptidoglycan DD-metalloendopeptidase family protein [Allorhizobium sp. BGMRC 0089]|uniref:peptidoglycan DD-metalloendopeptidase family protein n=1 Tax=Allorhizobium sonneratiae TaxID=2934936 RepID=UPI002033DA3F|nr:peptidoglycan DD-metalloendopeptidase family protein [Allorhizobium sonneratiae]MCM2294276.1 peptidoglycan DD-metalloendopeptidase family protein [Allorhizobium sonneratiae]